MTSPRSVPGIPARTWLGCCLLLWSVRLGVAWAASRPAALVLGAGLPDDRPLFEPGALLLLEVLRLRADLFLSALGSGALLLFGGWAVLIAITTGIVARIVHGDPRATAVSADWLRATVRALPRVGVLSLLAGGALLLYLVLGGIVLSATRASPWSGAAEPTRDAVLLFSGAAGLLGLGVGGILFDLTRVHLVTGVSLPGALRAAWARLLQRPGRFILGRIVVAAASLLVVWSAASLVGAQRLDAPQSGPTFAAFAVHRVAGFLLAAVQVTWLSAVVRWRGATPSPPTPFSSLRQP